MSLSKLLTEPWAISVEGYKETLRALKDHNSVVRFKGGAPEDPEAHGLHLEVVDHDDELEVVGDGVAVIPIAGYLTPTSYWPGDRASYEWIGGQVAAAVENAEVREIVLSVDSAGGSVPGAEALASQIFEARASKSITAFVSGQASSAGYWLASSASRIVIGRTSILGSIGVLWTTLDFSKMDAELGIEEITIVSSQSPAKDTDPKTDDGRARIQAMVDAIAEVFISDVARNRGVSTETVISDFGGGWVLVGESAIAAGMADELGTLEAVISSAGGSPSGIHIPAARGTEGSTMDSIEVGKITAEFLNEHRPELVVSIVETASSAAVEAALAKVPDLDVVRAESTEAGATAERERVLGIQAAAEGSGNAELVAELVGDSSISVEAAEARLFQAHKAERKGRLDARKKDDNDLDDLDHDDGSEGENAAAAVKAAGDYATIHGTR